MWEIKGTYQEKRSQLDFECLHCNRFFNCDKEKLKGSCLYYEEREEEKNGEGERTAGSN